MCNILSSAGPLVSALCLNSTGSSEGPRHLKKSPDSFLVTKMLTNGVTQELLAEGEMKRGSTAPPISLSATEDGVRVPKIFFQATLKAILNQYQAVGQDHGNNQTRVSSALSLVHL